jgi:hypothetical protein
LLTVVLHPSLLASQVLEERTAELSRREAELHNREQSLERRLRSSGAGLGALLGVAVPHTAAAAGGDGGAEVAAFPPAAPSTTSGGPPSRLGTLMSPVAAAVAASINVVHTAPGPEAADVTAGVEGSSGSKLVDQQSKPLPTTARKSK